MSEGERKLKVTDKRMFTADGELREDFRHLESAEEPRGDRAAEDRPRESAGPAAAKDETARGEPAPAPEPRSSPGAEPAARRPDPGSGRLPAKPGFLDLVGALAEPIALFLGDVKLPDGRSTEDLEAARFHIDLLEVVKQKTAGNLSAEESALLEDLLYRLRLRYVQKSG